MIAACKSPNVFEPPPGKRADPPIGTPRGCSVRGQCWRADQAVRAALARSLLFAEWADRLWRRRLTRAGGRGVLSGSQVLEGIRLGGPAIGCGDLPGDELRRSQEWFERGHELDVRWRAHELPKRPLVFPDR